MSGIEDASTTEYDPNTDSPVITLVSCPVDAGAAGGTRLAGNLRIRVKRGTRAYDAYRKPTISEAFHCNYELNPDYRTRLEKCGLVVSGVGTDGSVRIVELPLQWFFVATGFVPQYQSTPTAPHPLITAYLRAALDLKKLKAGKERPETLEHRWDVLYQHYPEVYEEFASARTSGRQWLSVARKLVDFRGKTVADIGSGSGKSSFLMAKYAGLVIGVEPEAAMTEIALENARQADIRNVVFKSGSAFDIPLADHSVDITTAVTGAFFYDAETTYRFVREAERVTRPGGHILIANIAPRWYGGELAGVIMGKERGGDDYTSDIPLVRAGFQFRDFYYTTHYGSVDRAVATYGFIFGRKAIDYLRQNSKSAIKWKGRVYCKQV